MTKLLDGRARADACELRRGKVTYTYETLRRFRSRFPGAKLWFLAGADAAATLDQWRRPAELRRACRWLVGRRPGFPRLPRGSHIRPLPGRFPAISSAAIRARLLSGLGAAGLVPSAILRHIRRRKLYGLALREKLRRTLPARRWLHTKGVLRLAVRLAELHGEDPEAAALAALLHDCARRWGPAALLRYVRKRRLRVPRLDSIARRAPLLAHSFVSADLARRRFGVEDPRVLAAIRDHTLGRPGMDRLGRLLFVADAAAEGRGFPAAARLRRLALRDLDAAFRAAVEAKLSYIERSGRWIHPDARAFSSWARGLP